MTTVDRARPSENPNTTSGGRGLRAILASVGVSTLGDGAFLAAVPLTAAALTRDPAAVAAVTATGYLPWVVIAPFAGALVDRLPYRATLLTADIARCLAVVAFAVAIATGNATVWALALTALVAVAGQVFHDIALQAAVAELAHRDPATLDRVNGRMFALETFGRSLVGPPAGAAAFSAAPVVPYVANAVSFGISAAILARLPRGLRATGTHSGSIATAAKDGLIWLARHRQLRTLALLAAASNLAYNIAFAVFVLYATDPDGLGVTQTGFGFLIAALASGGVISGMLASRITRRFGPERTLVAFVLAHAAAWPAVAFTDNPWIAAPILAVVGGCTTIITTVNASLRQVLTPADMLGRVIAGFRWVANSASPLGAVIGGLVATGLGLQGPLVVAGIVLAAALAATAQPLLSRR